MARSSGDESKLSSDALENVGGPDSSHLRVSRDTKHESGIPPARESLARGSEQLEHTLSEIARTEANLQSLVRGLRHLTAGAAAALESTSGLVSELDAIRELFAHGNSNESKLRVTVAQLSAALERVRAEGQAQLRRRMAEDDLFIAKLLNQHERELSALEQRRAESMEKREHELIAELTAQRDQARAYALQCERERDLAWQDLGVKTPVLHQVSTPSPPPAEVRKKTPIGTVKLRVPEAELASEPRATTRHSAEYSLVDNTEDRVPTTKPGIQSTR